MSITNGNGHKPKPKNVLGGELKCCCLKPLTGFYRDGFCQTGADDVGSHTVCTQVTDEFLEFSRERGNDLSTPRPEFNFPGLKNGDKWCLCVLRWREALEAGCAPRIILEATHEAALKHVLLKDLQNYSLTSE
ncbi:MAG: DUF2237 domain-containing protein [Pyrinomonadaceae bacterium]|jgi:uncharacterized protein (DUF2237 family)|nr:DUF2237 domain-containing protein [Acidobacteriota bacterium]